jgi:hypothetical protein
MATENPTSQKGSTRDALDEVNFRNDAIKHTKSLNDENQKLKLKELIGRKQAANEAASKKLRSAASTKSSLQSLQGLNTQSITPFK